MIDIDGRYKTIVIKYMVNIWIGRYGQLSFKSKIAKEKGIQISSRPCQFQILQFVYIAIFRAWMQVIPKVVHNFYFSE